MIRAERGGGAYPERRGNVKLAVKEGTLARNFKVYYNSRSTASEQHIIFIKTLQI
ncbi:unnamed protein product [Ixodes persulcatus]